MAALEKTQNLLRLDLPLEMFVKNDLNPNKMSSREFDLLVDNVEKTGLTDPILVRPLQLDGLKQMVKKKLSGSKLIDAMQDASMQVRIVGGHHRYDVAAYLGFDTAPATIIMDEDFDDDAEKFQIVRMNVIRGKMDPNSFLQLYNQLSEDYSDEVMQDAFGFAEEAEFKKLITQMAKVLPDAASQKKFKDAAAEIKTVDGLAKLLNEMFTKYGDTLPYGYMVVDYNGQKSMWLRVESKTLTALEVLGTMCIDHDRTVDDIMGGLVQLIAKGELAEVVQTLIKKSQPANIPTGFSVQPTKDNLEKVKELS